MNQINVTNPAAEQFQSDHTGRELSLTSVRYQCPPASFDGGLVF